MKRRALVFSLVAALGLGAAALAIAAQRGARSVTPRQGDAAQAAPSGALPTLWRLPPFSFADQNGRATTPDDLRGHVFIANFFFTRCTSICPLITAKMALLQRRLASPSLRFVSFSVNPKNDTPDALKRYAAEWRPGETRWTLLATTPDGLQKLASAMFVAVEPVENDIAHTKLFFLVDAQGGVRGVFQSEKDEDLENLVRATEALSNAPPSVAPERARATNGAELYRAFGCGACHARRELAPPLEGLAGRRVALAGGTELTADAAYVRESIVAPDAKLVSGYLTLMPSYEKELTPEELDALVEHTLGLTSAASAPAASKPPEAAKLVVDPVCSMKVRAASTTLHASHAGKTVYFCSDMCRARFVADPGRYAAKLGGS